MYDMTIMLILTIIVYSQTHSENKYLVAKRTKKHQYTLKSKNRKKTKKTPSALRGGGIGGESRTNYSKYAAKNRKRDRLKRNGDAELLIELFHGPTEK